MGVFWIPIRAFRWFISQTLSRTTDVPKQIMSNFQAVNALRAYANKHLNEADENVKSLYQALGFAERQENRYAKTLGKGRQWQLDCSEMQIIEKVVAGTLTCHNAISYSRLLVRGKLFSTAIYDQKFAHCNSIVSTQNSSCYEIVKTSFYFLVALVNLMEFVTS